MLEITTDYSFIGNSKKISCSYKGLMKSVKVGSNILIADGSLSCKVLEILEESIMTEVLNTV
jgi:pyruvate kinase